MMNRFFLRLSRARYSKGFGVQSPFAFHLINDVINQKASFYAYSEIESSVSNHNDRIVRLSKLYFRLANYHRPRFIFDCCSRSDIQSSAFLLACPAAKVLTLNQLSTYVGGHDNRFTDTVLIRMCADDEGRVIFHHCLNSVNKNAMILIEGINRTDESKAFWRDVSDNNQTVLCFDLYYVGVVLFDNRFYKHNYIVNF